MVNNYWAIIRYSGRTDNIKSPQERDLSIWDVFDIINTEMQSAGSNHDSPKILLLNGKEIPIPENKSLTTFIWEYQQTRREAVQEATDAVRKKFVSSEMGKFLEESYNGK
jgi:hypothetical protein